MAVARTSGGTLLVFLVVLAGVGTAVGHSVGRKSFPQLTLPRACPLPHHVPKFPGVASLRFAMVHDVLTERYPRHGPVYYQERVRLTRLALAAEEAAMSGKPTPKYFELIDDLGVGLDLLGQHEQSISLLRDKLKKQKELGHSGMDLYGSYANLGTFIILWEIHEGLADKEKARAGLTEGLGLIKQAIAINPQSHFGREVWQAAILKHLLAVLDDPEIAAKTDMVGHDLNEQPLINPFLGRGTARRHGWASVCGEARRYLERPVEEQDAKELKRFRGYISTVRRHNVDEDERAKINRAEPAPFDEPTLGIVGMWRIGGGPNPFFAIALGELMSGVGQNYIAWNAYERARMMAGAIGSDAVQRKFREVCDRRQQEIELGLPETERDQLRPSFRKHLERGLAYQKACQDYEARKIHEGTAADDPHFYDAFDAEQGPIASPVGDEDRFLPADDDAGFSPGPTLLGAGVFAFLGCLFVLFLDRCTPPAPA